MDIQELFIGAWVLLKINESNRILREPHRVTGIMTSNSQHYVQTDESDAYRGLDCYEPIPITEGIMRSSGFIIDLGSATYTTKKYRWLEYRLEDSVLIDWFDGAIDFQCPCEYYVHTLQAALRLCGSEIEIII